MRSLEVMGAGAVQLISGGEMQEYGFEGSPRMVRKLAGDCCDARGLRRVRRTLRTRYGEEALGEPRVKPFPGIESLTLVAQVFVACAFRSEPR